MRSYIDKDFEKVLKQEGIEGFDGLWHHPMQLVEEGNFRKAGEQSEVSRWRDVYVKKQQNYKTRMSRYFKPKAVCGREFENIQAWRKMGIPTLEALYFHQEAKASRAILITRALDGYISFEEWLNKTDDPIMRGRVFKVVAETLADINRRGWYHRCYFPKHIFVREDNPESLKIIDLEKARRMFRTQYRDLSEIVTFYRRCPNTNPKEMLNFMKAYWGVNKFTLKHRKFLQKLEQRLAEKRARHA